MQTESSELLDVVDEHDCVVGSDTRGEIHRQGLMHRSVHVLVFDGSGSVLLQKRSMLKDECAGMWDTSCAGHVESGQDYSDTAPRELQEELGITIDEALSPLFKMSPNADNGYEFAMVYSLVHQGPFSIAEDEIDELQWFEFSAVDQWANKVLEAEVHADHDPDQVSDNAAGQNLTSGFIEIWRRFRSNTQRAELH